MRVRRLLGATVAVMAIPTALWLTARLGLAGALATSVVGCLALGVVVSWPAARGWIAWPGAVCAATSLVATISIVGSYDTTPPPPNSVGLAEMAGLLVLLSLVARWSPPRAAVLVGAALGIAATSWILRFMPDADVLTTIGGCFMWSLGAVVAATAGGYPRLAEARLRQSVEAARDHQRLQLAHDLHDFIAHDVTGMVAQAQAARFAAGDDPEALRTALQRIERTGQEALSAMDTLVEMLRDSSDPGLSALGLKGLPDIVEAFRRERPDATVILTADETALSRLPPEIQLATTRVIAEGLTNIRRHAANASRITVSVQPDERGLLAVQVANDQSEESPPPATHRRSGKTGLATLRQRIHQLGGNFHAGPDHTGGWTVTCRLPIPPRPTATGEQS